MSSRSQDSAKLAELATQLETQANNLNLAAQLLARYDEAINALEQRVIELEQANDDLDRRLLSRGASARAQATIDLLPATSRPAQDYDEEYGSYIRG